MANTAAERILPDGTTEYVESRMVECLKFNDGTSDKYYVIVEVPTEAKEPVWLIGYGRNGYGGVWRRTDTEEAKKQFKGKIKRGYKSAPMTEFDKRTLLTNVKGVPQIMFAVPTLEDAGKGRTALVMPSKGVPEPIKKVVREDPATWAGDW